MVVCSSATPSSALHSRPTAVKPRRHSWPTLRCRGHQRRWPRFRRRPMKIRSSGLPAEPYPDFIFRFVPRALSSGQVASRFCGIWRRSGAMKLVFAVAIMFLGIAAAQVQQAQSCRNRLDRRSGGTTPASDPLSVCRIFLSSSSSSTLMSSPSASQPAPRRDRPRPAISDVPWRHAPLAEPSIALAVSGGNSRHIDPAAGTSGDGPGSSSSSARLGSLDGWGFGKLAEIAGRRLADQG